MTVQIDNVAHNVPLQELQPLFDAAHVRGYHHPLSERKWLDLTNSEAHESAGIAAKDGDVIVGYAHILAGKGDWNIETVIANNPDATMIERELLLAALRFCTTKGGLVRYWKYRADEASDRALATIGFHLERVLDEMTRQLPIDDPVQLPSHVTVRSFDEDRDSSAWIELNNLVFANHAEQGRWEVSELNRRLRQPWFHAEDFLVAENDDQLVGWCWGKRHSHNHIGEIYSVGVRDTMRGTGLGRALTIACLRQLSAHDCRTALLFVDDDNEAAVEMYQKRGFAVVARHRAYVAETAN